MAKDPAYPMYAQDFDMDTAAWSALAVGVYLRLMNYSWINGPLPDDTEELARIARLDHGNFKKVWCRYVKPKWTKTGGGLVNRRMEEERSLRAAYIEKQRIKGKRSAETRWGDTVTTVTTTVKPRPQPEGQPEGNSSSSSSLKDKNIAGRTRDKKPKTKEKTRKKSDFVFSLPESIPQDTWNQFAEMRKKIKKPLTPYASHLIVKELEKIKAKTGQGPIAILNESIKNAWQGVFPLKENNNGTHGTGRQYGFNRTPGPEIDQGILEQSERLRRKYEPS